MPQGGNLHASRPWGPLKILRFRSYAFLPVPSAAETARKEVRVVKPGADRTFNVFRIQDFRAVYIGALRAALQRLSPEFNPLVCLRIFLFSNSPLMDIMDLKCYIHQICNGFNFVFAAFPI